MSKDENITILLSEWRDGNEDALNVLLPLVEAELRRIAHNYMKRENAGHTLQTTALINEAYLKLIDQRAVKWQNRAHFFAISAKLMRRILINHARDSHAQKRGGAETLHLNLDDVMLVSHEKSGELIALDEALERLAEFDSVKSQIVEMRYFGGLLIEETAEVLGISASSVSQQWRMARAWLKDEIRLQN